MKHTTTRFGSPSLSLSLAPPATISAAPPSTTATSPSATCVRARSGEAACHGHPPRVIGRALPGHLGRVRHRSRLALVSLLVLYALTSASPAPAADTRLRLIVETDAGGDPDDEQSLVRFLLYANEWDVEGIVANRPVARDGENRTSERTGLGIVRRAVRAYGECHARLVEHDMTQRDAL